MSSLKAWFTSAMPSRMSILTGPPRPGSAKGVLPCRMGRALTALASL